MLCKIYKVMTIFSITKPALNLKKFKDQLRLLITIKLNSNYFFLFLLFTHVVFLHIPHDNYEKDK